MVHRCNACNEVGDHHFEQLLSIENIQNVLAIKTYENKTKNKKEHLQNQHSLVAYLQGHSIDASLSMKEALPNTCLSLSQPVLT